MKTDRFPIFCDIALAARIERAEARFIANCGRAARRRGENTAGFVIPVAGGSATFAADNSPYNKLAGVGFDGIPTSAELDQAERAFAAHGAPVQVELSSLAEPAIGTLLAGRGYQLVSFENVLGRALAGPVERVVPGVEVRPSGADEFEEWLDVVVRASLHPDSQGVPWQDEFPRHILENAERDAAEAGVTRYAAYRDGVIAGGAGIHIAEGVAQLAGAATAPEHRRRGVQTALTAARLADAAAAGCDIAVVTTQPGSKSQQNMQRQGFDLLYTRAVLVKATTPRAAPSGAAPAAHAVPDRAEPDSARNSPELTVGGQDADLHARLDAELLAFNTAATGTAEVTDLSVRVTDGAGELVGGLSAYTWGGLCGIEFLWVRADERGGGWGTRLLLAAEAEARRRGCDRVILSSFTFQAPDFYRRHGYVETDRTPHFPGGHAEVHLFKPLAR